jgi:hypothetical protein
MDCRDDHSRLCHLVPDITSATLRFGNLNRFLIRFIILSGLKSSPFYSVILKRDILVSLWKHEENYFQRTPFTCNRLSNNLITWLANCTARFGMRCIIKQRDAAY